MAAGPGPVLGRDRGAGGPAPARCPFPHDAGDPVLNTWLLWWSTREVPLTAAWWNAPIFHPMRDAMALSEVLIGLLPITAPVQWLTGNPVAAYNAAFLLSFVLSGLAAYALVAELTGQRAAAVLAGLAFAFGPYRMSQLAHVQVLSDYGAPIALLGLHRYVRTGRARWLAVFGAAWLLQAFANGYALFHLSVLLGLWLVWFVRADRPLVPILGVWAVASLPLVPVLIRVLAGPRTAASGARHQRDRALQRRHRQLCERTSRAGALGRPAPHEPLRDSAVPGRDDAGCAAGWRGRRLAPVWRADHVGSRTEHRRGDRAGVCGRRRQRRDRRALAPRHDHCRKLQQAVHDRVRRGCDCGGAGSMGPERVAIAVDASLLCDRRGGDVRAGLRPVAHLPGPGGFLRAALCVAHEAAGLRDAAGAGALRHAGPPVPGRRAGAGRLALDHASRSSRAAPACARRARRRTPRRRMGAASRRAGACPAAGGVDGRRRCSRAATRRARRRFPCDLPI